MATVQEIDRKTGTAYDFPIVENPDGSYNYAVAANHSETTVISTGTAVSAVVNIMGKTVAGLALPAAWDAADLTIQVSLDNVTWFNLYAPGADEQEYTLKAAASRAFGLIFLDLLAWNYVRFRSGTSGAPVNQTANRTLTVVTKPF